MSCTGTQPVPPAEEKTPESATLPAIVASTNTQEIPTLAFTVTPAPELTLEPTATIEPSPEPALPTETLVSTGTATSVSLPSEPPRYPTGAIVVDHRSVDLFNQIPDTYLAAARNLRMMYMDQSVGMNISEGLDCLMAVSWSKSPAACRRDYYQIKGSEWLLKTFSAADLEAGVVPAVIQFQAESDRYNRSNWTFVSQPGTWKEYLKAFIEVHAPAMIAEKDVLSFQFTYLHVAAGSDIADPQEGFFVDHPRTGYYRNQERWDISDLVEYEAQNPGKIFIYWTSSLARGIGSAESTAFNDQMRQYAIVNQKPLFDVADILSYDPAGMPCYDNRDGVEYCGVNGCENHSDDGINELAICQAYTTELEGGHLGSVSGGKIQLAKAFWVLMAQIAGWEP